MTWPDIKAPAVGRSASLLQQFKGNLSPAHPCRPVPQMGRDSQQFQLFKDHVCSPPYQPPSRLTWELFSAQRVPCAYLCATLWFCLHYHEESMGQWDASNVEAGVCELQGIWWPKRAHTGELALWLLLTVPQQRRRTDTAFDPMWSFCLAEKGSGNEYSIQELRGSASGQGRKGITRFIWVHGFDGPAHLISWLCFS